MTSPIFTVDRLVRKEVALGVVREKQPPMDHMGLASIAPMKDVATDDVIFGYIFQGLQEGLAPARAEDAEAELSQKDQLLAGQGSASVIDWSIADRYSPSDVTRYREDVYLSQLAQGTLEAAPPALSFLGRTQADFEARLARDDTLRRRKLDNRLEWLIMTGLFEGAVTYNDGKIKFTVDYARPANQNRQVPASGFYDASTTFDPIGDFRGVQEFMYNTYGFRPHRAITSHKVMWTWWNSDKYRANFIPLFATGAGGMKLDPNYLSNDFGPDAVVALTERQTGITFQAYDSVYQTRSIGSTVRSNVRFTDEKLICFLPTTADFVQEGSPTQTSTTDVGEIDDTEFGFAKTLTSPHPEGNWTSGYYEWEQQTVNPWNYVRGTGLKAFPIFPYLELTYTMKALT